MRICYRAAAIYRQLGTVAQEQRRFEEAEQYYRQAMDVKLEISDRRSFGSTYFNLGMVAQEQRRLWEAEQCYRQALDVYVEFGDSRRAARIYHQLGLVMVDLGLHSDALEMLLRAATWWRTETGDWPDDAIRIIRQQRPYLSPATYQHVVSDVVPDDIRESLDTAVAVVDES